MKRRTQQSGAVLMAMLAVLILGAAWWTVTAISQPINRTALDRNHNARILQEAKSALIGYVAHRAAMTTENDPGRLPCPEAAGNIGTANEGIAAGNCTLPAVGRLPWRTLGLDKWRDIAGEPLWYAVSPGWAKPNAATNTVINSNSTGQLTLDATGDMVALIIAPGRPLQVSTSPGCSARIQRRTTPSPTIDLRDYLECENATTPANTAFQSAGPADSFNDQVLSLTSVELLPAIEAAVSSRIERQIAPQLRTIYATNWGLAQPIYSYPKPFADPGTSNNYQGAAATCAGNVCQGLLPFNYSEACDPATDTRCTTTFIAWSAPTLVQTGGIGTLLSSSCVWLDDFGAVSATPTATARCTGTYLAVGPVNLRMSISANNLAMGLREVDDIAASSQYLVLLAWVDAASATSKSLGSDGAGTQSITTTLPSVLFGPSVDFRITMSNIGLRDHPLLDATDANTGWFVRNQWYRLTYYTVAQGHTASVLPTGPSCTTGTTCLSAVNVTPAGAQRAMLIVAGRSINGSPRPSGTLTDYLEFGNATSVFERRPVSIARLPTFRNPFNDRIVVIDQN